jgi:L-lactate utilization protein LutB
VKAEHGASFSAEKKKRHPQIRSSFTKIEPESSRCTKDKKGKTLSMATFLSHSEFTQLALEKQIEKTVQALQAHGIQVVVFDTGEEARTYVLDLIPPGAEVYDSPSRTLELIGLAEQIEHATHFQAVRARL